MEWQKAGRPRKNKKRPEPWHGHEMALAKDSIDGMRMLARAVVRQWALDGKPASGLPGIAPWLGLLEEMK